MKLRTFSMGGVHPEENKLSSEVKTTPAALPAQAVFPLSQHIGARQTRRRPWRQGEGGHDDSRGRRFRLRPHLLLRLGHGAQDRQCHRRHRIPQAIHHHQGGRRRMGGVHRPLRQTGDPCRAPRTHPGGHRGEGEERRHHRHGRCGIPHVHQTLSSTHGQGGVHHHQRRGMRAIHHRRLPPDDGTCRRNTRGLGTPDESRQGGQGLYRHRGQQARRHPAL